MRSLRELLFGMRNWRVSAILWGISRRSTKHVMGLVPLSPMTPQDEGTDAPDMAGEGSSAISACRRPRVLGPETSRGSPLRWQEDEVEEAMARVIETWVPCELKESATTSGPDLVDEELHVDIYILIRIFKLREYWEVYNVEIIAFKLYHFMVIYVLIKGTPELAGIKNLIG